MADLKAKVRRVAIRLDTALSSRPARLASTFVAIVALLLAGYVGTKQWETNRCLAVYADASARSTAARADAAAQDRKADDADRAAADGERVAFLALLESIESSDKTAETKAFADLTAAYKAGDVSRAATAKTRALNEQQRAKNPVPPPPSLKCG